jgi:MFS family permease
MRLRPAAKGGADRALLAFIAEGFFSRLSFGILTFVVPLYALQQGMDLAVVGLFLSVNVIVSIALKPVMGALADRVGYKRALTAAIVIRSAVTLVFAFALTPLFLFAARGMHGVSIALRDPALCALLADHGGKKKVAQNFAWWQTAKSLAGNGSKIAGGLLLALTHGDFQLVFLIAFVLSLVPVYVVLRHVPAAAASVPEPVEPEELPAPQQPAEEQQVGRSTIASFAGLGFLISLSAYMVGPMFPIIMVAYAGVSLDQAGLIYGLSGLVALASPGFGWLADNVSNKLVLSIRSVANMGSSALYIVAPNLAGVAAGRVVDDLGKAAFKPAWGKLMADVSAVDKRRRARLMGYMSSGEDAGEALGPIVAGLIMSIWTIPIMLGVRIIVAGATEIFTIVLTRTGPGRAARNPPRVRRLSLRVPAGALAAVLVGFAVGWTVQVVQPFAGSDARATPRSPAASAKPHAAKADSCSLDPTVRAIREAVGAC